MLKINAQTKSLVERLCDFKIYAISVLSFIGSVCAPDKATTRALQCTAIPSDLLGVGSVCGIGPDQVGIHSIRPCGSLWMELLHVRPRLDKALRKSQAARWQNCAPYFRSFFCLGDRIPCTFPWPVAPRTLLILFVAWTVMSSLMKPRRIRNNNLPLDCSVTSFMSRMLLDLSPFGPRKFRDQSVVIELRNIVHHMKLVSRASRPGLTVGVLRILCNGVRTAQRFFTLRSMNIRAVLDARMNLTLSLSLITTIALVLYDMFTSFW